MREARYAILLVAIGLIATGAQAADLVVSAGATVNVAADANYDGIYVDGELNIAAGVTVNTTEGDGNPTLIGYLDANATAVLNVDGTLNCNGGWGWPLEDKGEEEYHCLDIGGQAKAEVTISATGYVDAGGQGIGVGQDQNWYGDPIGGPNDPFGQGGWPPYPDSGYDTRLTFETGATLVNFGSLSMGAGEARPNSIFVDWHPSGVDFWKGGHNANVVVETADGVDLTDAGWTSVFMVGGTLEVTGTLNVHGTFRCRTASGHYDPNTATNMYLSRAEMIAQDRINVIKLKGDNPVILSDSGWQMGGLRRYPSTIPDPNDPNATIPHPQAGEVIDPDDANAVLEFYTSNTYGCIVDLSEANIPTDQWYTILDSDSRGGWNPVWSQDVTLAPGQEGLIRFRGGNWVDRIYEVYIPEPASMALLAVGGIGILLRKRR